MRATRGLLPVILEALRKVRRYPESRRHPSPVARPKSNRPIVGTPKFRHSSGMEIVKIGKKGQVTIPRRVLEEAGLPAESQVIVETEADGSIRLRPAAVYPIELYRDERIAEFERENQVPDSLRERAERALNRRRKK